MNAQMHRSRSVLKVLAVSLVANILLGSLKVFYGRSANSLSFVADGLHTYFDACATLLGMISIYLSAAPPDEDHPYGHYKFETLSSLLLSMVLIFAAYEVGSSAYSRLDVVDQFPRIDFGGVFVVTLALMTNYLVGRWEMKMGAALNSPFLKADSVHNLSDLWTSAGVVLSMLAGHFKIPRVDAWISLLISMYLVFLSLRLLWDNAGPLVDARMVDPERVEAIACSVNGVLHCHHVRSRGERGHYFVDLKLHLPGSIPLHKAHDISHEVERKLKAEFPGLVDVVIHTEPDDHPPC